MTGRVLIVDDNEHNLEYARQVIDGGWPTELARDGQQALDAVAREQPGMLLLDLSMPGIDGWEVIRRLKADTKTAAIPVAACSAHAMAGDRERGFEAGFDAYLAKPYRPHQLRELVASFLGPPAEGGDDEDWGDDELSFGTDDDWDSDEDEG